MKVYVDQQDVVQFLLMRLKLIIVVKIALLQR